MSLDALSLCKLGNELYRTGLLTQALAAYNHALESNPDYPEALNNRGIALLALGDAEGALKSFDDAVILQPGFAEALYNRGNAQGLLRRLPEAVADFDAAISARPGYAEAHNNRGNALQELNRPMEALQSYSRALEINPFYTDALENKAILQSEFGRDDAARLALEAIIVSYPTRVRAHFHLTRIKRMTPGDPQFQELERLERDQAGHGAGDAIKLNFALAKAYDDIGDSDRAFACLARGNALKRDRVAYNETYSLAYLRRTASAFRKEEIEERKDWGDNSAAPIFILGMPRSGSTLVEQILSCHPEVSARGECDAFQDAATRINDSNGRRQLSPEFASRLSRLELTKIAQSYLQNVGAAEPGVRRTTDKSLGNFVHAGLISLAFPRARLIHTRRDPVDTCWSCFSQPFSDAGGPPYAQDLGELGRYYKAYDALMRHWRRALPEGAMLEVEYEDIVADIEAQTRRILAFCGLEWAPRCLDFHKSDRHVRTASAAQVRRPIYKSGLGRWKPYERHLGPLFRELGSRPGEPAPPSFPALAAISA